MHLSTFLWLEWCQFWSNWSSKLFELILRGLPEGGSHPYWGVHKHKENFNNLGGKQGRSARKKLFKTQFCMIFYIEFGNKFNFLVLKVFFGVFLNFLFPQGNLGKLAFFAVWFFFTTFLHCDDIDVGTRWKAWNVKVRTVYSKLQSRGRVTHDGHVKIPPQILKK